MAAGEVAPCRREPLNRSARALEHPAGLRAPVHTTEAARRADRAPVQPPEASRRADRAPVQPPEGARRADRAPVHTPEGARRADRAPVDPPGASRRAGWPPVDPPGASRRSALPPTHPLNLLGIAALWRGRAIGVSAEGRAVARRCRRCGQRSWRRERSAWPRPARLSRGLCGLAAWREVFSGAASRRSARREGLGSRGVVCLARSRGAAERLGVSLTIAATQTWVWASRSDADGLRHPGLRV
jgi:hypothetical protein